MNATVDTSGFSKGMAGLVDRLGLESRVVLKKEMGELLKTLIRITPPKDPSKTRASIDRKVTGAFNSLGDERRSFSDTDSKVGKSGIKWYAADNKHLFGVAPDSDMRDSSQADLLSVYYRTYRRTNGRAYLEVPFNRPRKTQRVAISVRILTKKSQVRALVSKIRSHVGRLKAGWLGKNNSTWNRLNPTGSNMPPQWVTKHAADARGYFIDGTADKNHPLFTIANHAVGIGNPKLNMTWLVQGALAIRAKAMKKNLSLFLSGKKNLSSYSK